MVVPTLPSALKVKAPILLTSVAFMNPSDTVCRLPALPVVGADEPADVVTKLLATRASAVLVQRDGTVSGILTRFDMLQFIAGGDA